MQNYLHSICKENLGERTQIMNVLRKKYMYVQKYDENILGNKFLKVNTKFLNLSFANDSVFV